jgi:hypothetical protein
VIFEDVGERQLFEVRHAFGHKHRLRPMVVAPRPVDEAHGIASSTANEIRQGSGKRIETVSEELRG